MTEDCSNCTSGILHTGTPAGSYHTLNDVITYVAKPSPEALSSSGGAVGSNGSKKKAILFLPDIFGFYVNSTLLADSFANRGLTCYIPDYLNGDPVDIKQMNTPGFTLDAWRPNHTEAHTRPVIDKLLTYLRTERIERIGVVGYCFGGKYAFDLASSNAVEAAMMAHPSGITVAAMERVRDESKVPILFNACEVDQTWTPELQQLANEMYDNRTKYAAGFKQNYFEGCTHGFATRGDVAVPAVKYGKEKAFEETIDWFELHL